MFAKIGAVTVGQIWWSLWRATVWVLSMILIAYALDMEWSWKILVLCIGSSFFDFMLYRRRQS